MKPGPTGLLALALFSAFGIQFSSPVLAQGLSPAASGLTLDRWLVNSAGFVAPKSPAGGDAIYEVVGVTNALANAQSTCDLQINNHANPLDAAVQVTITDPAVPFAIRSGDTVNASGDAGCVLVLTVLEGYSIGSGTPGEHP